MSESFGNAHRAEGTLERRLQNEVEILQAIEQSLEQADSYTQRDELLEQREVTARQIGYYGVSLATERAA
ncbi:hypothetical protein CL689_07465 [Candidatus Saccharibacteria bacterium]|nr:hypothetical protein [Candidatus Saccharibacteria bacterium]MBJ58296.1 hypothetical protein [Candidatus Saccharibacteria bacterium]MBQ69856.1 hypothetical protein [Candidatus Saccharibacteria bacterium]